jgi:hypothetical protein
MNFTTTLWINFLMKNSIKNNICAGMIYAMGFAVFVLIPFAAMGALFAYFF